MHFDDASKALVELAAGRHNAFHTTEAASVNISDRRLRRGRERGELRRLRPAVWAHSGLPDSDGQLLRSATLSLKESAATGASAAWLHGWLDEPPRIPQVWVPKTSHARAQAVGVHRFNLLDPSQDIENRDGIRTLNKAATLCVLGAFLPGIVERCLDDALRTESERWLRLTIERLWTPHHEGPRALRSICEDPKRVSGVTDSWMERVLARLVVDPSLPPMVLQHHVEVDGRSFRMDVACPELRLGIEAHSRTYHWGVGNEDADNVRDLLLTSVGWDVLYVTYAQLRDPDAFVATFRRAAHARAAQLGHRLPLDGGSSADSGRK